MTSVLSLTEIERERKEKRKKMVREDELRKSCIIERLRSFVVVPYGLVATFGNEGSDKQETEEE